MFLGNMAQICFLVEMLVLSSLVSHGIGNILAEAESVELRDTSADNFVSPETPPVLCGQRPAMGDIDDDLDKIIGGRTTSHGEFPWTVTIYGLIWKDEEAIKGHTCGGAIISEFWVLTAAHCVGLSHPKSLSIVVGDFDRNITDEGEQTFLVDYITHELFTGLEDSDHNIALVKVAKTSDGRGIRFNDYVQPICLPDYGQKCSCDESVVATGWGASSSRSSKSVRRLKSVRLRCRTNKFCRRNIYSRAQISDNMFCAGTKRGKKDVCDGDLGGPGALKSGNLFILIGIMSHGTICQKRNYPVIFASVSAHLPWIENTIAANSNFGEGTIPRRRVMTEDALSATSETLLE